MRAMHGCRCILVILFAVLATQGRAEQGLSLDPHQPSQEAAGGMRYIAAEGLDSQQALARLQRHGQRLQGDYPRLGFVDQPLWFLLPLEVPAEQKTWFLEASLPYTDRMELFWFDASGDLLGQWRSGDRLPFHDRPLNHPHHVFPLELPPGEHQLLLRVDSENLVDMPVTLYTPEGFRDHEARRSLAAGFYYGIVAIMCLYNLLIFLSIRDSSYLYYVLYLGTFGLMILQRNGLALQWLWPESPWWNHHSQPVLVLLTLGLSMLFADRFLGLRNSHNRLSRGINVLAWACVLVSPLALLEFSLFLRGGSMLVLPWTLAIMALAAIRVAEGFVSARYFLLAFTAVGLAASLFALRTLDLLESTALLEYSLQAATALEALLLSFALAHRMTALKQENARIQQQANEELEQRVRERTRELHQALNARSEFLATISHEVRTPLNGILGNIDLIRDKGLNAEQARHLRVIEQSGHTLLHLINDILDYSKIEAGRMELEQQRFDLRAVVEDCASLFERKALDHNIRLTVDVENNGEKPVCGDPLRLSQVLGNLISNAVKFTRDGNVDIRIRHEAANPDYVLFEVADTGTGIDQTRANRLFEHFYQVDASTSRRHGGTGLGLAICRQLVELMGGEIGVESEPGKGSCFWFRIPLPAADQVDDQTPASVPAGDAEPINGSARLLVVDDNHINLMVAEGICKKLGHKVVTAESGMEAVAVLLSDPAGFDLVLMDCEMPEMDGFETTAEIHRLQAEGRVAAVPVIALTAHAIPEKVRACREAGMVSHIAKPINTARLGRAIRRALDGTADPRNDAPE